MIGGLALSGATAAITDRSATQPTSCFASSQPPTTGSDAQLNPSADGQVSQQLVSAKGTTDGQNGDTAMGRNRDFATVGGSPRNDYGSLGGETQGGRLLEPAAAEGDHAGLTYLPPAESGRGNLTGGGGAADAAVAGDAAGAAVAGDAAGAAVAGNAAGGYQVSESVADCGSGQNTVGGSQGGMPGAVANAGRAGSAAVASGSSQDGSAHPSSIAAYRPGHEGAGFWTGGGSSGGAAVCQAGSSSTGQGQGEPLSSREMGGAGELGSEGTAGGVDSGAAAGAGLTGRPVQVRLLSLPFWTPVKTCFSSLLHALLICSNRH